jgi:hypothetical protein
MIHFNPESKETLKCYYFGSDTKEETLAYKPDINTEEDDKSSKLNKKTVKIALQQINISGKEYAYDKTTNLIYDYDQYKMENLVRLGKLEIIPANPKTGEPMKYNYIPDH